jgi:hypothetical protein
LIPVTFPLGATVIARRDARGPQPAARTCCLRTTDLENNKETFFGDFLPLSKKLPAACGGSFCPKENNPPPPKSQQSRLIRHLKSQSPKMPSKIEALSTNFCDNQRFAAAPSAPPAPTPAQ